jgi:hypothetical protein
MVGQMAGEAIARWVGEINNKAGLKPAISAAKDGSPLGHEVRRWHKEK